ncbi:hypothetical protein SCOCK_540031 [Actinacidiphila cocklensis]|uniref:Uncharacterized protein n=1 Tax=Actinacidiphila cocklensis TaxID=887465 RepID=A0A9W4DWG1_9ACTN|nr:hypothetical protein SCOCK_540031 [Actinacidiphila cocklensis]
MKEVAEFRRANEILKAASPFFAAELDRPIFARDVHRRVPGPLRRRRAHLHRADRARYCPSTYYAAKARPPSARAVRDAELKVLVREAFEASSQP